MCTHACVHTIERVKRSSQHTRAENGRAGVGGSGATTLRLSIYLKFECILNLGKFRALQALKFKETCPGPGGLAVLLSAIKQCVVHCRYM